MLLTERLGSRRVLSLLSGLVLPLAVAAALAPLRAHVGDAALALVLAAVVVAVAAFGQRQAGILASLSSGVWFDFFLTRPYERFTIASAHDVETTIALLVVGVATTEIAVRGQRNYAVATTEGEYLALLHDLSDLVATGAPGEAVLELAERDLLEVMRLDLCRFEPGPPGAALPRLGRNGEIELGEKRFDVARDGLPSEGVELATQHRGRELGHFVLHGDGSSPVSIESRVVALAIADQVGAVLAGGQAIAPR